jgi:tRNA threonylcarbamoyladenosine biosynthesis protein TsaE
MATHDEPAVEGRLVSRSAADTRRIGRQLGRAAGPGTCLALEGPLGAGKTQLAKGVAEGLEITSVVNSPTFIIMNEHAGRLPLFHVDAYRLADGDEANQAGVLDERQAAGVTVIEWADRLDGWLPADRLRISLVPDPDDPDRRAIHWHAIGPRHAALATALTDGAVL